MMDDVLMNGVVDRLVFDYGIEPHIAGAVIRIEGDATVRNPGGGSLREEMIVGLEAAAGLGLSRFCERLDEIYDELDKRRQQGHRTRHFEAWAARKACSNNNHNINRDSAPPAWHLVSR